LAESEAPFDQTNMIQRARATTQIHGSDSQICEEGLQETYANTKEYLYEEALEKIRIAE